MRPRSDRSVERWVPAFHGGERGELRSAPLLEGGLARAPRRREPALARRGRARGRGDRLCLRLARDRGRVREVERSTPHRVPIKERMVRMSSS